MQGAGGGGDEPSYTRRKIREFLCIHTAYELIPESGKVIMLDADLPMRQGFHALHEQVGWVCKFFLLETPQLFHWTQMSPCSKAVTPSRNR